MFSLQRILLSSIHSNTLPVALLVTAIAERLLKANSLAGWLMSSTNKAGMVGPYRLMLISANVTNNIVK